MSKLTFTNYTNAVYVELSSLWKKRYALVSIKPTAGRLSDAKARMGLMQIWEDTVECYRLAYAYASLSDYWSRIGIGTSEMFVTLDKVVITNARMMVQESEDIFKHVEKQIATELLASANPDKKEAP